MLKCPRCPRTELDIGNLNLEMSLSDFKIGFPIDQLYNVEHIVFSGHTGDPIYANEFLDIVAYIKQHSNCRVTIVTNGSYRKVQWWQSLATLLTSADQVIFSVDGWDHESNIKYRKNSNFESIISGATTLRQGNSECQMIWSAIYFSFNQHMMGEIQKLALSLGFDTFTTVKSSKFDYRYAVDRSDQLKPSIEFVSKTALYEHTHTSLNEKQFNVININSSVRQFHPWARCANHAKSLFINVAGIVHPCVWFSDSYQPNTFLYRYKDRLSVKIRPLADIVNDVALWDDLLTSFSNNPHPICQIKCKNAQ